MEDKKTNTEKRQSYSGKIETPAKNKVKLEDQEFIITFRENRKFDLHIGRNILTFLGRESKPVPALWLKHKDWGNVSKYFIVKGA